MTKRIGLVQTGGIGDIVIAIPIADFYLSSGWDVVWPIGAEHFEMFARAKPSIRFLRVERTDDQIDYALRRPLELLKQNECERTIVLYSYLRNINIPDARLAGSLKFDEYKYAIAGVPFQEKWNLQYERDLDREASLFERLNVRGDYVCIHDRGSGMPNPAAVPRHLIDGLEQVYISDLTDSIFDWRLTLEQATRLILVDSCISNLVEQIGLPNEKALILRSAVSFTPVYMKGWNFIFPSATTDHVRDLPAGKEND